MEFPLQTVMPNQIKFNKEESDLISKEVETLLDKGAIERVYDLKGAYFSSIFIVPKKDGSLRPIINLRNLNEYIEYHHFKQEN